jgi:hypothetical protein
VPKAVMCCIAQIRSICNGLLEVCLLYAVVIFTQLACTYRLSKIWGMEAS